MQQLNDSHCNGLGYNDNRFITIHTLCKNHIVITRVVSTSTYFVRSNVDSNTRTALLFGVSIVTLPPEKKAKAQSGDQASQVSRSRPSRAKQGGATIIAPSCCSSWNRRMLTGAPFRTSLRAFACNISTRCQNQMMPGISNRLQHHTISLLRVLARLPACAFVLE